MLNLSIQQQPPKEFWELTNNFMHNIKVGDGFMLNGKSYAVKCLGKWKSDYYPENQFKTLTIKCLDTENLIKFFYFFGYEGNPKSKSKTASVKQHQFVRELEGAIITDLLNSNNPFHNKSDIYQIATR